MGIGIAWAGLAAVSAAALLLPVKVKIFYSKTGADDLVKLDITWMLIWRQRIVIPMIAFSSDEIEYQIKGSLRQEADLSLPRLWGHILQVLEQLPSYLRIGRHLHKGLRMRDFRWHTRFGLPDAAETAWSIGALWALKGIMVGRMTCATRYQGPPPDLKIIPRFNSISGKATWETEMECTYDFRPGHLLHTGYRLWKDGRKRSR